MGRNKRDPSSVTHLAKHVLERESKKEMNFKHLAWFLWHLCHMKTTFIHLYLIMNLNLLVFQSRYPIVDPIQGIHHISST